MKGTLEFLAFVWLADRLVPFICENHPEWNALPFGDPYQYLAWFWERRLLAVSQAEDQIYGVCTIRLFDRLEDWLKTPFVFEPSGKFCLVDLLVAVSPLAIADCLEIHFKRWGPQEIVIWERGDRTEQTTRAPRMYRWDQYLKLTKRLTYGAVKEEDYYGFKRH